MHKLLTTLILSIFFVACNNTSIPSKDSTSSEKIAYIDIPFLEHGYNQHPSKLIISQYELNTFLTQVSNEEGWNKKEEFLKKFQDLTIDFKTHNLLFYRITETSTSNQLNVLNNAISISKDDIIITIERTISQVGDAAMAYYAVAYKVAKDIQTITFENGKQEVVIENKKSNMIVPKNCEEWFDGCNTCARSDAYDDAACTEMSCSPYKPQDFRCTLWK